MSDAHDGADHGSGLVDVARRRWRVLILGLATGLLLAVAYAHQQPSEYVSTASVLVGASSAVDAAQPANGQGLNGPVNLATEALLVKSFPVVQRARDVLGDEMSLEDLRAAVSADVPTDSSVLQISFTWPSAENAQRGAHAFALAYLVNRQELGTTTLEDQVSSVQARMDDVRKLLETAAAAVAAAPPNSADAAIANASVDLYRNQLATLTRVLGDLQATSVSSGRLIVDASRPSAPTGPSLPVLVAAGALLGLLLGIAVALLRERTDRRIRTADDVERLLDVPTWPVTLNRAAGKRDLVPAASRTGQDLRRIGNSLLTTLPHGPAVLLVAGVAKRSADLTVARNIAATLAGGDREVLLVDADPESSTADATSDDDRPGLAEVISGDVPLDDALEPVPGMRRLRRLGPGRDRDGLSLLLQGRNWEAVLAALRSRADFVVVRSAPVTVSPDAQTIARHADAGLLVVRAGRTSSEALLEAVAQLVEVRLTKLSCLLTGRRVHRRGALSRGARWRAGRTNARPVTLPANRDPDEEPNRVVRDAPFSTAGRVPPTRVDTTLGA
jgi:capsular polysaccharide biosynthesis protein/Mrp family chromosome partitioning ATPase